MSEKVFREIKNVMSVISMLQLREKTFREELEFFNLKWEKESQESAKSFYFMALKRLEHEVGFLCIDTYSLYQGIENKKSLYSKIVKDNGRLLSKIDKTPSNRNTFKFLGICQSNGKMRPFTLEEENNFINQVEEEAYKSRERLKRDSGITSYKHNDLDEWKNTILDRKILSELTKYRQEFAHRLDSLDNLKQELEVIKPQCIEKMLDIVSELLNSYYKCFQNILGYTKSQDYLGVQGLKYDSLSRLKLADSIINTRKNAEQ